MDRDARSLPQAAQADIYARASTEAKRKALEAVYDEVVSAELTEWNQDPELLNWLTMNTSALCAALDRQPRSQQAIQAGAAHNPALLIWSFGFTAPGEHLLALRLRPVGSPVEDAARAR